LGTSGCLSVAERFEVIFDAGGHLLTSFCYQLQEPDIRIGEHSGGTGVAAERCSPNLNARRCMKSEKEIVYRFLLSIFVESDTKGYSPRHTGVR